MTPKSKHIERAVAFLERAIRYEATSDDERERAEQALAVLQGE